MIYIGYYTIDTPYETVITENLYPSLLNWNLKHDIAGIKDLGNWGANTSFKPEFIKDMLIKHKEPIVFLDADAKIHKNPVLFNEIPEKFDMAVHFLNWFLQWRGHTGEKRELLSGTMMMRNNDKIMNLLDLYIKECQDNPNQWEQRILQDLLAQHKEIKIYHLPASYCTVVNHKNEIPTYVGDPVIVHYQASRKYKDRRKW